MVLDVEVDLDIWLVTCCCCRGKELGLGCVVYLWVKFHEGVILANPPSALLMAEGNVKESGVLVPRGRGRGVGEGRYTRRGEERTPVRASWEDFQ